jgi:hypothetical protein
VFWGGARNTNHPHPADRRQQAHPMKGPRMRSPLLPTGKVSPASFIGCRPAKPECDPETPSGPGRFSFQGIPAVTR